MNKAMFVAISVIAFLSFAAGTGLAFEGVTASKGEASPYLLGTFECREEWKNREDTLLVLINGTGPRCACITLLPANQAPGYGAAFTIAGGRVELSSGDTDVINLCSVLHLLASEPYDMTQTGEVRVAISEGYCNSCPDPDVGLLDGGVYGWVKNVVYKGSKKISTNPFTATVVSAVAQTPLRVTPREVLPTSGTGSCCFFFEDNLLDLGQENALLPKELFVDGSFDE